MHASANNPVPQVYPDITRMPTRCSDKTAFMYLGNLVEFGDTMQIFEQPREKQTEAYVTGTFG